MCNLKVVLQIALACSAIWLTYIAIVTALKEQNNTPKCISSASGFNGSKAAQCEQLWKDKLARRERRLKERADFLASNRHLNEKNSYDPFEPDWDCEMTDRVGTPPMGDGAKYMCGHELLKSSSCLVYGVGGGDFMFEKSIRDISENCEIHGFDPTFDPEKKTELIKLLNIKFHPIGIGSGTMLNHKKEPVEKMLIPDIMAKLGHVGRRIDVFKIDCESCEFDVLPPIFQKIGEGEFEVGQILVEMHGTSHDRNAKFFASLQQAKSLFIFHKERNHDGCDGYRCVEYGILSRKSALEIFNRYTGCDVKEL